MSALALSEVSIERGGRTVVREVSLEVPPGEITALLGDYRGGPWDPRADVWMILAKKPIRAART